MDGVANTLGHEMTAVFVGITLGIFINPQNRTTAMNGLRHNGKDYVWANLADSAANVSAPTALVFGLGKSCMNAGLLAGTFLGLKFGSSSSMLLVGVLVFIVYLFIVLENALSPGIGVTLSLSQQNEPEQNDRTPKSRKVTIEEAAKLNLSEMFNAVPNERCSTIAAFRQCL